MQSHNILLFQEIQRNSRSSLMTRSSLTTDIWVTLSRRSIHIVEFHSNSMHFSTTSIMHPIESIHGHQRNTTVHLFPSLVNQIPYQLN
ncbi:hypothetical protein EUGRSUZ_I02031 [Eucalyptus grandis]|uniref:Uncharacterized protein n=2 Tax=Eucalyptus grandis TaxID=71139 RepID=A0ACC3JIY8_EUCGR|nr:hypothetical protein EUGRSUZ_I02031 [Eucalyptus grandis]